MADIIISVASAVAGYLVAPIGRQLGYLFNYHSNVEELRSQLVRLGDAKGRVMRDVVSARRNGDEIEPDVENWLKSVDGITEAAEKILDDEDKAKKRCFNGLCPNWKSRYLLSKKSKKTAEVVKILGERKFDRVSYRASLGIEYTSTKGYEAFESRMSTLKEIIEALKNPNIYVIGVYGMGGAGKTTLVKEVAKQARQNKLFDQVVMSEVSDSADVKKVQGEIADMLGLKFDQESESGRARWLCERLKKEESILVILDNIWERLDLEAIGIPFGDDHEGCKILLTSRSQEVLSNDIDTQKNFGIGVLPHKEAWNLFKKIAGDSVEDPDLQPTAIEVAKKCAGLPIAIVTVAKALKNKHLFVWKDALQQLRGSNSTNVRGMHANVYSSLELSYHHLESEELKSLFLLCGIITKAQLLIKDLLKYSVGLGLLRDINSLEEARNRVHTLLHDLKASSLLLESTDTRFVKIHDVVRDVAVSIASKDQNGFMLRYGVGLKELPKKDILKDCTVMSLPDSNIHTLPECLKCPVLKFFLLYNYCPALKIPDTFFKEMKELKVLDLTQVHFSSLPSSLHFLGNLQTLCLDCCMLGDIAIIGELKSLEILSFIGSDIVQLPREIAQLTRLRLLDLKNCSKLQVISPNVISSLSRLEELWMENSFVQWEADGLNSQRCNASLDELKNLSCLTALEVHVRDAGILPKGLLFENLIRYRILVGNVWDWSGDRESSRTLKLKLNTSINLEDGVKMLLKRTEDLYLDELMGVKNVLYELDKEGFRQLKHLHVQSNPETQHIISTKEWVPCIAFPVLESLFLNNLTSLEEICHGQLPMESFCKLRVIKVECCDKLKSLFSLSQARGLLQLREINITECKIMDGVVAEEIEDEEGKNEVIDNVLFPQLSHLTLQRLPELLSFCSKVNIIPSILYSSQQLLTTHAGSGEIISEGKDDSPTPFFDIKNAFPSLEFLKLSELSKLRQIWHGQPLVKSCNLRRLEVENCAFLLNIASSNLLQSLQNLKTITVKSCDSLEQVFDLQGLNCDEEHAGILSQLAELKLCELSRLTCIWNKDPQGILSFQNLKWLNIEKCNSLKNLFSPSMALDFVELRRMRILDCDMMEEIVEKEKGAREEAIDKIVFPLLSDIILKDLPNLKSFYPGNHNFECPSLKRIIINSCPKIKTFTSTYEGFQESSSDSIPSAPLFNKKVTFPNLEKLSLYKLPSLMAIWKKDSQGIFPFQKLHLLYVGWCDQLRNIFTTSMAKSLVLLQKLSVTNCEMVEEIVAKEQVEAAAAMDLTVFPQISSLILRGLPQLKSFYQGVHISEWPSLKKLIVSNCEEVKIFASEVISFEEICDMGHLGTPTKQPLFLVDKVAFPDLEEMNLIHMSSMEEIWQGQFHTRSFCKLRDLVVKDCNKILNVFPMSLLRNVQNLEKLYVGYCSSLEEVFELEGLVGDVSHPSTFPRLTDLMLHELPNLMHLWKEDSQLSSVFQNLTTLKVRSCGSLTHLLPSTIAESLLQIKSISIADCKMMKEIIASEKGKAMNEITFNQLNFLELTGLPNLTSFCPSSNAYSFPSLEKVLVKKCPKLKTFSNNVLSTPKLEKVQVKQDKWLWDGDLNTTIQQLFKQKDVQVFKED